MFLDTAQRGAPAPRCGVRDLTRTQPRTQAGWRAKVFAGQTMAEFADVDENVNGLAGLVTDVTAKREKHECVPP